MAEKPQKSHIPNFLPTVSNLGICSHVPIEAETELFEPLQFGVEPLHERFVAEFLCDIAG